jgi:hypothetical protein
MIDMLPHIVESIISATLLSIVALMTLRHYRKISTRDATAEFYREWWSHNMAQVRWNFFNKFIPEYLPKLREKQGATMKDILTRFPDDGNPTKRLERDSAWEMCVFFDKLGWLGAAELVNVDHVLGPMQHLMRKTWLAMEPFITPIRDQHHASTYDPVFQLGFHWLFVRSNLPRKQQAKLLRARFRKPRVKDLRDVNLLGGSIATSEKRFEDSLSHALPQKAG